MTPHTYAEFVEKMESAKGLTGAKRAIKILHTYVPSAESGSKFTFLQ